MQEYGDSCNNSRPNRQFFPLPTEISQRKDITASAKVIAGIIAYRTGKNGWCWPGIRSIFEDAGVTTETVIAALKLLEAEGLLEVDRRGNGRSNRYRLIAESAQEIRAPKKSERPKISSTSAQEIRAQAPKKLGQNQKRTEKREEPPNPPQAGDVCESSQKAISSQPEKERETEDQVIEKIDVAHRAVFGHGASWSFKRKARREFRKGDSQTVAEIDAAVIRAGRAMAEKAKKPFGFGWVINAAAEIAAKRIEDQKAEARRKRISSQTHAAEVATQPPPALEYFDGLPAAEQAEWISIIKTKRGAPERLDLLRGSAAALAWRERNNITLEISAQ